MLAALTARGHTLATAESLTGGLLAAAVTDVPGASRAYLGGVVSYATRVKTDLVGVPAALVAEHGVVSAACAGAMAEGVRALLDTTYGLSTTGVAGPDLQEGHPAGTVFIGVAGPTGTTTLGLELTGGRDDVRRATCAAALDALWETLTREVPGLG